MKIGVVMPVYLGDYLNAASDRERKFIRAVQSFLDQSELNKELVIVSDGCDIAEKIYNENFSDKPEIIFKKIEKQPHFSGTVRNTGVALSTAEIISYLDSDDILFGNHLADITHNFGSADWVLFNDYVALDHLLERKRMRGTDVQYGCVGTSSIAHKKNLPIAWPDGYSHDWKFIYSMSERFQNKKHITATGYCVCHVPTILDV